MRHMRRQFLVNYGLQIGLALRFFLCMVLVALLTGWAVYYAVWKMVLVELKGVYLANLYHAIGQRLVFYCLIVALALAVLSIFFSHKIAGPIYKIQRTLDELAEKNDMPEQLYPIRLRKRDYFKDLAATINKFIEKRCIKADSKRT